MNPSVVSVLILALATSYALAMPDSTILQTKQEIKGGNANSFNANTGQSFVVNKNAFDGGDPTNVMESLFSVRTASKSAKPHAHHPPAQQQQQSGGVVALK